MPHRINATSPIPTWRQLRYIKTSKQRNIFEPSSL
jgi:hypothetical protein